jgi:hypothetical protein
MQVGEENEGANLLWCRTICTDIVGSGSSWRLPSALKVGSPKLGALLEEYPWFEEFGAATYWDYNRKYLETLSTLVDSGENPGPVTLFKSKEYFIRLAKSWDSARSLSPRLVKMLQEESELKSYVNNVWALRRCIMAFDTDTM